MERGSELALSKDSVCSIDDEAVPPESNYYCYCGRFGDYVVNLHDCLKYAIVSMSKSYL
jgi:hypothetical protein